MSKQYDFKKEWPKIKKELLKLKKDTMVLAQKGEKELRRLSVQGRIQLDIASLKVKKEHLLYLIGKEYIKSKPAAAGQTAQLKKLTMELGALDKDIKALNRKLKTKSSRAKKRK